ncbi:MAG TPA: multidrug efflux SMR transporter [Edaphocola sp.]|nr:multidrug efflux SMR transporter [Edaphocola sp.]
MHWIILIIAGFCEIGFATCLGYAQKAKGMSAIWGYTGFIVFLTISMLLLMKATQAIPLGTAYAVWTGIGAVGTVLMGIFFFKEPVTFWKMFFTITLIGSIVGLKAISN